MRYFLRIGEGGLSYVDSELTEQEFVTELKNGKDFHPLYDIKGNHMKTYPSGLFTQADVLPSYPIVPFNGKGVQYRNEKQGFVVMVFKYDKVEVTDDIKQMGNTFNPDDKAAIESYLNSYGATYLRRKGSKVLTDDMFGKCIIDEDESIILFISKPCMLMQGPNVSVIFNNSIHQLPDNSPYALQYSPAQPGDIAFQIFS